MTSVLSLPRPILFRSLRAFPVVGAVLWALNQGDLLLRGDLPPAFWWKVPLTHVVPFPVATYGALGSRREREREGEP